MQYKNLTMSDSRKKLSVAEYRKQAVDKIKKDKEVIAKTPKLTYFFKTKNLSLVEDRNTSI